MWTSRVASVAALASATASVGCSDVAVPSVVTVVASDGGVDAGGCATGELPLGDGTCRAPGVARCAPGFESDGADGCRAIVPDSPCGTGELATPGETMCHPVAPCGRGPWGAFPAGRVEYVDAAYGGGGSDGTEARPWTKVQAALDAAPSNGIIALAAGSYVEDLAIDKAVRFWGRCPELTELVGAGPSVWSVLVTTGASGTELHDLSIRGPGVGIGVIGAKDVALDRVWIHATGDWGVDVEDGLGPASATATRSLIEKSAGFGAVAIGDSSLLRLDGCAVRDIDPPPHDIGAGVLAQENARAEVHACIFERHAGAGIRLVAAKLTLDATLFRNPPEGPAGEGVLASDNEVDNEPSEATVLGSVFERPLGNGIDIDGSSATLEDTVVRDVLWSTQYDEGGGISVGQHRTTSPRPTLMARGIVVERAQEVGLLVEAAEATIEGAIVRDTLPHPVTKMHGRGIEIIRDPDTLLRADVVMRGCRVERSREIGVLGAASDLELVGVAIEDTLPEDGSGRWGMGLHVQRDSKLDLPMTLRMSSSTVARSFEAGISLSETSATIEDTSVAETRAGSTGGQFGDGVIVVSGSQARTSLARIFIEGSARAGVSSFGSTVSLAGVVLECNAIDLDGEQNFGAAYAFDDLGGNVCGCRGAAVPCKVLSTNLEPPEPIEP